MARHNQGESDGMGVVWLVMIALPVVFGWMCWSRWHGTISYWGLKWAWHQLAASAQYFRVLFHFHPRHISATWISCGASARG